VCSLDLNIKSGAELIIIHSPIIYSKPLLVCIPINIGNSNNLQSSIIKNIIEIMSKNAPSKGKKTNVNIPNFNLNTFVPLKPFYTYTGNEAFQPCSTIVEYIVFDISDIFIDNETYSILKKIITKNKYLIQTNKFYYNKKGPHENSLSDNIYIDCQPVNTSNETKFVAMNETDINNNNKKNLNNFLLIIFSIFLFVFIFYIIPILIKLYLKYYNKQI
jgi:hypothetical protein